MSVLLCKIFLCGKCTRISPLENIHLTKLKYFHKCNSFINIFTGRYFKIHLDKTEMLHFDKKQTFNSKRVKMFHFKFNIISYNT